MSKRCGDGAVAMIAIQKCFSFYQQLSYFEHATPPVTVLKRLSNNSESSGTVFLHRGIHYPTVGVMRIGLGWLITTSMTVALFREEKTRILYGFLLV